MRLTSLRGTVAWLGALVYLDEITGLNLKEVPLVTSGSAILIRNLKSHKVQNT